MIFRIYILVMVLISGVVAETRKLDLQDCYVLALAHQESLGMKAADAKVAEAQFWQTVSGSLPKIHAIGTETWSDPKGVNQSSSGSNFSSSNNSRNKSMDSFEGKLQMSQPLFHGFRDFYGAAAQKSTIQAREQDLRWARRTLYLDVASAFYQVELYEGDLRLLEEQEKTLIDRASELERRVKLGKSRRSEQLSAQTDLAEIRVVLQQTKGTLGASRELLAFLTGVPSKQLQVEESKIKTVSDSLEVFLREAKGRPDLLAAQAETDGSKKILSASKAEHLPGVDVTGSYSLKELPSQNDGDWTVALTMDLPLFDGGLIEARVREKKALVQKSELNLRMLQRTADREVRTRFNDFSTSSIELNRAREWVATARENYQVQQQDYERGVVGYLEVLDSLRRLSDARRKALSTELENRLNWVELHVAAGREVGVAKKINSPTG